MDAGQIIGGEGVNEKQTKTLRVMWEVPGRHVRSRILAAQHRDVRAQQAVGAGLEGSEENINQKEILLPRLRAGEGEEVSHAEETEEEKHEK